MGDTTKKSETKTEMEKTENTEKMETMEKKGSRSANFEELRDDLFREAAKLVSEDPSRRIAILMTPRAGASDNSTHSFSHPSVEGVLQPFLEDKRPVPVPEEESEDASAQRFWWEDEKLLESTDLEELKAASESMSRLMENISKIIAQRKGNPKAEPKP